MPCVGIEPTIPASERAKTVHALGRSTTVTGHKAISLVITYKQFNWYSNNFANYFYTHVTPRVEKYCGI
jgi:hypothetical protein